MAAVEEEGGLVDQISGWQLARWQAYDRQEPFGETRADMRMAANSIWAHANEGDPPSLVHPYFVDEFENLDERLAALKKRAKEIASGNQHREIGDSPRH